jgi:hypothetical protein
VGICVSVGGGGVAVNVGRMGVLVTAGELQATSKIANKNKEIYLFIMHLNINYCFVTN